MDFCNKYTTLCEISQRENVDEACKNLKRKLLACYFQGREDIPIEKP